MDKLLKEFRFRAKKKAAKVTKAADDNSGFPFQEFRRLFAGVTGFDQDDEAIAVLCKKVDVATASEILMSVSCPKMQIDAEEEGFINEQKFMTYLLQQFRERDAMANSQPLPFQETLSFKINVFSKVCVCVCRCPNKTLHSLSFLQLFVVFIHSSGISIDYSTDSIQPWFEELS